MELKSENNIVSPLIRQNVYHLILANLANGFVLARKFQVILIMISLIIKPSGFVLIVKFLKVISIPTLREVFECSSRKYPNFHYAREFFSKTLPSPPKGREKKALVAQ